MIAGGEGKKKKKRGGEKKRQGWVSKAVVPLHRACVGWTWTTALGTGHLITAGKLEKLGMSESPMKGLLGLAWGERLKDWNMYRLGKWQGSLPPSPHSGSAHWREGNPFQQAWRILLQRNGAIWSKREMARTVSGASDFGSGTAVSFGIASPKKL